VTCDLDRSLKAVGPLLEFVDRFVETNQLDERLAFATRLVTEELFANLVRHNVGGRDRIEVDLTLEDGLLTLCLKDFDVEPFDAAGRGPVDVSRPLSERSAGGLGIHFVRSFFDELSYNHSGGTMSVAASKRIRRSDV
jgi:anti-sigma regulatory factor (Ser/Thr protein kinase)